MKTQQSGDREGEWAHEGKRAYEGRGWGIVSLARGASSRSASNAHGTYVFVIIAMSKRTSSVRHMIAARNEFRTCAGQLAAASGAGWGSASRGERSPNIEWWK